MRKGLWAVLALMAALGVAGTAPAAPALTSAAEILKPDGDWRLVEVGELDSTLEFIAPDSRVVRDGVARVWSFSAFRKLNRLDDTPSVGIWLLWQFDCQARTAQAVQVAVLNDAFAVSSQEVPDDQATPLVEDTLSDKLYRWACLDQPMWKGGDVNGVKLASERAMALGR